MLVWQCTGSMSLCLSCAAARRIWKDFFVAVNGVVFIIDAFDRDRFAEAKEELDVSFALWWPACFVCV